MWVGFVCFSSCFALNNPLFSHRRFKRMTIFELNLQYSVTDLCYLRDDIASAHTFLGGECVPVHACARKPLLTEAQGVASCSRDRTGP